MKTARTEVKKMRRVNIATIDSGYDSLEEEDIYFM